MKEEKDVHWLMDSMHTRNPWGYEPSYQVGTKKTIQLKVHIIGLNNNNGMKINNNLLLSGVG